MFWAGKKKPVFTTYFCEQGRVGSIKDRHNRYQYDDGKHPLQIVFFATNLSLPGRYDLIDHACLMALGYTCSSVGLPRHAQCIAGKPWSVNHYRSDELPAACRIDLFFCPLGNILSLAKHI